jgi:DNA-binding CsgD family transcriptional regulator
VDVAPGFLARALILASILKWSDDFEGARAVLGELRRSLTEREEEGPLIPVLFHLAELECWAGNIGVAREIGRDLERSVQRLGPSPRSQAHYLAAFVAAVEGDADRARAEATSGLAVAEGAGDARQTVRNLRVLGLVALSLEEGDDADRHLGRAASLAAENSYVDPGFFRVAADAIEASVAVGDLERAEPATSSLQALGRRLDRPWALATGARSRGLVAAARGDLIGAAVSIEEALRAHDRLPEPLERGRTLLALGSVYRQARRKRDARTTLDQAITVFEAVGAPLWVDRARRQAARIGGRVRAGGDLSETERRIAKLVSDGRSNAEVARAMSISRKTVEWNLSNIYRKVGVRSRTELARRSAAADG